MLNRLISKFSKAPSSFKGITGVIERCTRKQISGWLITEEQDNPDPLKFLVMYRGANWVDEVELWHRPGLATHKKDNLYGFRLRLKPGIKETAEASVFYAWNHDLYTLPMMVGREIELASYDSEVHFNNRVFASAEQQAISIRQPGLITESLKHGSSHEITESVSEFLVPAGIKSPHNVAITGKNGHLFLFGGSNKVDQLFNSDAELNNDVAAKWDALIQKRYTQLTELNCQLVQMIIPEKQSVIPDSYYRSIGGTSPLLKLLEESQPPGWFSALNALTNKESQSYFYKTDSHLNSKGCWCLFSELLAFLNLTSLDEPEYAKPRKLTGDLGRKFAPFRFHEFDMPVSGFPKKSSKPELVMSSIPPNKRHLGRLYHWKNASPISQKRVMVFGNSFFEKGANPHQLTWWFAHYFAEVMFVWSPDVNIKLVKKLAPDIVVCQSIERFARLVPLY